MADMDTLVQWFTDAGGEYGKFERVVNKLSTRPDLHAILMLDAMDPGTTDAVSCASHDEIWLSFDPATVAEKITKEQVIDLVRCGIIWDCGNECFQLFA